MDKVRYFSVLFSVHVQHCECVRLEWNEINLYDLNFSNSTAEKNDEMKERGSQKAR